MRVARLPSRALAIVAVAPIAALAIAVGAAAQTGTAPPASCPPPASAPATVGPPIASSPQEAVIACVGSESLTEVTFVHWREIAVAGEHAAGQRQHGSRAVTEQVMGFLLSGDWLLGEARTLKLHVSARAVRHELEHLRRQQFPRRRDYVKFLRQSRQTPADLLLRVELDMLSARIQRKVTAGRGPHAQMRAMSRFIAHFRTKWRAQTYCAPAYAVEDCGHVQTSL